MSPPRSAVADSARDPHRRCARTRTVGRLGVPPRSAVRRPRRVRPATGPIAGRFARRPRGRPAAINPPRPAMAPPSSAPPPLAPRAAAPMRQRRARRPWLRRRRRRRPALRSIRSSRTIRTRRRDDLSRALISDLVTYFPQRRDEGLRDGTLRELFREEIKKSHEEYSIRSGASSPSRRRTFRTR